MRLPTLALLLVATIGSSSAAQANPQTREGFWISFGLGYGSLGCDENVCDERASGTNGYLRMGGTLSQRLLIGGEINAWTKSEDGATLTVSNFGPVLLFYPNANGGLFLKGGLGLSSISIELGNFEVEEEGVGLTIGIGYDARVGRNFSLTPFFDILTASYDGNDVDAGGTLNRFAFGLGFSWP